MVVLSVVIIAFSIVLLAALVRLTYLHMATGRPVTRLGHALVELVETDNTPRTHLDQQA